MLRSHARFFCFIRYVGEVTPQSNCFIVKNNVYRIKVSHEYLIWMLKKKSPVSSSGTPAWGTKTNVNRYVSCTVLSLSIQTLCKLHRHFASPNDIIFSIGRLHSKHLDRAHAMASTVFTILFCIPPWTSAEKRFCLSTKRWYGMPYRTGDVSVPVFFGFADEWVRSPQKSFNVLD